jgi:hypothetical protein
VNGDEVVLKFLHLASRHDDHIRVLTGVLEDLQDEKYRQVRTRLYATIQDYTLVRRAMILEALDLTPARIDEINPPGQTMKMLNGICGFYGADRVLIYLYLAVYLDNVWLETREKLVDIDILVRELFNG